MALGYWDSHGYPNFPSETALIEELADAMETSDEGATQIWNIDGGIEEVCEDHGYNDFDASNDYWMSWSEVKDEVDAS